VTPPYFVRFLPQRAAAYQAMRAFARVEEIPDPNPVEEWDGKRTVHCIATAPDGRQYGIGYEWTAEQAVRCLPRQPQPRFDCPSAVWPADVRVPLRELRR
jgi:hypothetical protein